MVRWEGLRNPGPPVLRLDPTSHGSQYLRQVRAEGLLRGPRSLGATRRPARGMACLHYHCNDSALFPAPSSHLTPPGTQGHGEESLAS